jgi:hypothetical protein
MPLARLTRQQHKNNKLTRKRKRKKERKRRHNRTQKKNYFSPPLLSLISLSLSFAKWGTPKAKKEERITEEEDKGNHRNSTSLRETLWRIRWNL